MKRNFVFGVVFLLVVIFLYPYSSPMKEKMIYFTSVGGNSSLLVRIADTAEARARGLMFVNELGSNEGMLFIFPDEANRTFWMKNTMVSLDMIFISSNSTVVGVVENATPCAEEPCKTYFVSETSKYVVEASAGFAEANGIKAGAKLNNLYQAGG